MRLYGRLPSTAALHLHPHFSVTLSIPTHSDPTENTSLESCYCGRAGTGQLTTENDRSSKKVTKNRRSASLQQEQPQEQHPVHAPRVNCSKKIYHQGLFDSRQGKQSEEFASEREKEKEAAKKTKEKRGKRSDEPDSTKAHMSSFPRTQSTVSRKQEEDPTTLIETDLRIAANV